MFLEPIELKPKVIKLYHVSMRLKSSFETSGWRTVDRRSIIVEVAFENGVVGYGEVTAGDGPWFSYETIETSWHIIRDYIAPILLRRSIRHPMEVYDALSPIRGHNMAKAGVEEAYWDAYAKALGKPLASVIGGVRDRVEAGVSIGIIGDLNRLLKAVGEYMAEGYRRVKIKIKPGWDVDVVKAVFREYPDVRLQVDANASYTLNDVEVFRRLDEYGLLMIEQPLGYDDLVDHAELQRVLKTPICLDESIRGLSDVKAAYRLGSCRVVNVKPGRVGGVRQSIEINNYCRSVNIPIWIGGMLETGIGRGFQVALAALDNVKYPNDIGASSRYYHEDIVEPPWSLNKDGTISVPNRPGIGVDVVEPRLRKYTVSTLSIRSR